MNGIEKLIAALDEVGLVDKPQDTGEKLGAEDIADILWLLLHVHQKQGRQTNQDEDLHQDQRSQQLGQVPPPPSERAITDIAEIEGQSPKWKEKPHVTSSSNRRNEVELYPQRSNSSLVQEHGERKGLLTRAPAASALPHTLDIARALRPLMRRVPLHTHAFSSMRRPPPIVLQKQKKLYGLQ